VLVAHAQETGAPGFGQRLRLVLLRLVLLGGRAPAVAAIISRSSRADRFMVGAER